MAKLALSQLSSRQRAVLSDLSRVRLLTGRQLERLHFAPLATPNARSSARRRTLGTLVAGGLVTTMPRRIGGERAGSAGLVYALDAPGHRLLANAESTKRIRRPWLVGWPFVEHSLAVAELYVRLRELEASGAIRLLDFAVEPASWYQTLQGVLKPDALAIYEAAEWEEHWWLEVDRATESLPTVERKLRQYVTFAASGQAGPLGITPLVLITAPTIKRLAAIQGIIDKLPAPAGQLLKISEFRGVFGEHARPPP